MIARKWKKVRLSDICKFKYGEMPKRGDLVDSANPVYSGYRFVGFSPRFHYIDPEIIVVARGEGGTGDIKMTPPRCFLTNISIAILVESPEVFKQYLYYRLLSTKLWTLRTGSAQAQITITHLQDYEVHLPSLETQRKIAGILSAYDDLIENNLRRIKILEEMAQSLYREWFVHFRFPGHESVKLVDSALGKIPEGWEVKTLGEIAEFRLGKMLDKEKNKGKLMPYLANVNVRWGRFELDDLREMRFTSNELDTYGLRIGDIVMCEGGEPGRCAVWNEQIPGMMIQKAIHRIRSRENMNYSFLYQSLRNLGRGGHLASLFTGATIKHLPREQLAKVKVVVPTRAILDAFIKFVRPTEDQVCRLETTTRCVSKTRDLLLPKLLNGTSQS